MEFLVHILHSIGREKNFLNSTFQKKYFELKKYGRALSFIIFISVIVLFSYYVLYDIKEKELIFRDSQIKYDLLKDTPDYKNVEYNAVQNIFNARCIACHGCYESPCQLNLQSYEGVNRGLLRTDFFNRYRFKEDSATRLYEDATSLDQWRSLGFKDIIGDQNSSILFNAVLKGAISGRQELPNHYPEERQCISHSESRLKRKMRDPRLAMPFHLPGLSKNEVKLIETWIQEGAKGPEQNTIRSFVPNSEEESVILAWENFLNYKKRPGIYKHRLTSRYIYEHLFLAHLYVKSSPRKFYTLIRSKTNCDKPEMISTRTPGTDPGVKDFYYCFVNFSGSIVNKNHLPYEISTKKLNWIKKIFIEPKWVIEADDTPLPPYQISGVKTDASLFDLRQLDFKKLTLETDKLNIDDLKKNLKELSGHWDEKIDQFKKEKKEIEDQIKQNKIASNPFIVFENIPQKARYQFLIEDSYYHIMTFMKGTVCNGTLSVNAVQDHFYVLFLDPSIDQILNTPDVLKEHTFPARYGDETGVKIITAFVKQAESRNQARNKLNNNLKKYFSQGLPLEAIWNGNKGLPFSDSILTPNNSNAILTIFRHNDSASVVKGPVGDLPKTVIVLDYANFERMSYDLVINFDVFGSLGHMLLTRTYMNLIRTDAENMYLSFLPSEQRFKLKNSWYNDSNSQADIKNLEQDSLSIIVRSILEKSKLTQAQLDLFYKEGELTDINQSKIHFKSINLSPEETHLEFIQKVLFQHLGSKIIGNDDELNWTKLKTRSKKNPIEDRLSDLTKEVKNTKIPFLYYFPELSYIILGSSNDLGKKTYNSFYSLMLNRQFNSIAQVAGEDFRRLPETESLTLSTKIIGYYPNQFFYIDDNYESIDQFVTTAMNIKSKEDYLIFLQKYGIERMNSEIWPIYDFLITKYREQDLIEYGYLDLSRYNFTTHL